MMKFDTKTDKILMALNYVLLFILGVIMILPLWQQLIISISPINEALTEGLHLYTLNPDFSAYKMVLKSFDVIQGFVNSFIRVLSGTVLSILLTTLMAYPLSKKTLPFRRTIMFVVIFTMMFDGGLIPNYLLMKDLKLLDNFLALIFPTAVTAYNLIIMKNFVENIPTSLQEAATIDGASDFRIWRSIVLPLSKPVLATVALWVAVYHWNAYFDVLIYITTQSKITLTIVLRRILLESQISNLIIDYAAAGVGGVKATEETVKAAVLMVSTVPIIIVYPFLQKYFVQGIMLGAVKE